MLSSFIFQALILELQYFGQTKNILQYYFLLLLFVFLKLNDHDLKNKIKFFYYYPKNEKTFQIRFWVLFGFLAFYVDQKFFFMPIIVYFFYIYKNSLKFFSLFSIINFLFFIPAIYLFYQWGGIVPIESQFRIKLTKKELNGHFNFKFIYKKKCHYI